MARKTAKKTKKPTKGFISAPKHLSRRMAIWIAAGVAVVGVCVVYATHAASIGAVPARSAASFIDSLGVNVHMDYARYTNATEVLNDVHYLGMSHVRDNPGASTAERVRMDTLKAGGIRFDFLVPEPPSGTAGITAILSMVKSRYLTSTDSIEGPNEYDGANSTWVADLKSYQAKLYAMVKGDPALKNLPVLGPSIKGNKEEVNLPPLGNIAGSMDYGNIHSYPGGHTPERTASNTVGDLESRLGLARQYTFGSKPYIVTESGYHNALNNCTTGHLPATERTAGIYMPRLFLEDFRLGAARTYTYELLDQGTACDAEQRFGMFRADGSAKPAATAVHNLTTLLSDSGSFTPASLQYAVTSGATDVHQVLLQKHDGSFWLAIWRSSNEANPAIPPTDLSPADSPLTISFGQPIISATTYRPNTGVGSLATVSRPTSLNLSVGGQVELVKIVTGVAATPPPATPVATPLPTPVRTIAPTPKPTAKPVVHPTSTQLPTAKPGTPAVVVKGKVAVATSGSSKATVTVDGQPVPLAADGTLDTDSLPNGDHDIAVTTFDSQTGKAVTTDRHINIENKLTPLQALQNALYLPLHGNKVLVNGVLILVGMAILAGIIFGIRWLLLRRLGL